MEELQKIKMSYMTKEEFCDLILNLRFDFVKYYKIGFITDFVIKEDNVVKPLGFNIECELEEL